MSEISATNSYPFRSQKATHFEKLVKRHTTGELSRSTKGYLLFTASDNSLKKKKNRIYVEINDNPIYLFSREASEKQKCITYIYRFTADQPMIRIRSKNKRRKNRN